MYWYVFITITELLTLSVSAEVYYVSTNDADCLELPHRLPCHEMSYYVNKSNVDLYFADDSTFIFLQGTHYLETVVVIASISNLSFIGQGGLVMGFDETYVVHSTVVVSCTGTSQSGLGFVNVTNLSLHGLTIVGCSWSPQSIEPLVAFYGYISHFNTFIVNSSRFYASVFVYETNNVTLCEISVLNTTHFGLVAINVFAFDISSSSFAINNIEHFTKLGEECETINNFSCSAGNILVMYTYSWIHGCDILGRRVSLEIASTNVSYGFGNIRYDHFHSIGGGITVFMDQGESYHVDVIMERIVAYNNTGQLSGNINFLTGTGTKYFTLLLSNVVSSFGNYRVKTSASSGGGMQLSLGVSSMTDPQFCTGPAINELSTTNTSVKIFDVYLTQNIARYGGAINIWVNRTHARFHMRSCQMIQNYGWRGISLYANQNNFDTIVSYLFENVTVRQSIYMGSIQSLEDYRSCISLFRMENFRFINLTVEDNYPNFGAYLYYSEVSFGGTRNVFRNCSTVGSGGALHLSALSSIIFEPNATLSFDSNHADGKGGAIYANTNQLLTPLCFMRIDYPPPNIIFINNTANNVGDAIFIDSCSRLQADEEATNEARRLLDTFDISNQLGAEPISSAPYSVHFCDVNGSIISEVFDQTLTSHPGEIIHLSIATLGLRQSFSAGLIEIDVLTGVNTGNLQTIFRHTESTCYDLLYEIDQAPAVSNVTLEITTSQEQFTRTGFSLQKSVSVLIHLLPCPTGFQLVASRCVCNRALAKIVTNITTNLSNRLFTRKGNVWFGYDNETSSLLVDTSCPFDYCNDRSVSFPITSPDSQCSFNRSGKVCGKCAKDLSLLLGSNVCGKCSSLWLLLIIPLSIIAGIALIVLLMALNLTVSMGTINGLIFYANVIKTSEFSFFYESIPVLRQFIAWFNLDIGISVCFYDGLDAIAKLWIQFLFPVYLFCLIIVIIVWCKYSSKAANIFGQNAVPVFATLILLSYTKLFRLFVPIFQYKYITVISSTNVTSKVPVWSVNPNIDYTTFHHMTLVVFALIVLTLFALPYTVILLSQPVTLKLQLNCFQKICLKLKPLFDAYYGPFKTKSMIWPGLLLCARLIMVIVAASTSNSEVYLSCCVAIVAVLLTLMICFQGVYTEWYLNILESCFLLNLAIVAVFVDLSPYIAICGVTLALVMFGGIIVFHVWIKISTHCFNSQRRKKSNIANNKIVDSVDVFVSRDRFTSTNTIELTREPLLFDEDI